MRTVLIYMLVLISIRTNAQSPSGIFTRITEELKQFKPDTTQVPEDAITRKIRELRDLRGVFNINEAVQFKIAEDSVKQEITAEEAHKLRESFTNGHARRLLDNAVINIYRSHFTHKELKQLVRFYRTPAGRKMAVDFPVVMLKSLMSAEMIKNAVTKND
jgi:uncharacterized protein